MAFHNIKRKPVYKKENQGFTFIEIIAVLVVLGVISAVAMATMSLNDNDLTAQHDALRSYIKYAQARSMGTTTQIFGIAINRNTDRYWIFSCPPSGTCKWNNTRIILPGGSSNPAYESTATGDRIRTSDVDVDISTNTTVAKQTIIFDNLGRPFTGTAGNVHYVEPLADTPGIALLSNNYTITLTNDNSNSRTITIIPETGFIQ